ncbi:hypothetical protein AB0I49_13105 [Streptomyces sp. NPDC050617]|uniref:hypothetical protein n=1 Tax=Streptomyces sp. NPDC050617 TaxID=3154628 RepID=UPI0034132283
MARPTPAGYTGIYVHLDGEPAAKLPLLPAAFQHRFGRDLEAMTRHLVDDVAVGWDELGSDLLDTAPPEIVTALTGGDRWPSRTMDDLITTDGSPPARMTVTETTAAGQDLAWGYVLRPHGIEVVPAQHSSAGPVVRWGVDPRTDFSTPAAWPVTWPARPPGPPTAAPPPRAPGHTPRQRAPLTSRSPLQPPAARAARAGPAGARAP